MKPFNQTTTIATSGEPRHHSKQPSVPQQPWPAGKTYHDDEQPSFELETRCINENHFKSWNQNHQQFKKSKSYSQNTRSPEKHFVKYVGDASRFDDFSNRNTVSQIQTHTQMSKPLNKIKRSKLEIKENLGGGIASPNGTRSSRYDQESNEQSSDIRRMSNPGILQDIIFDKQKRGNEFQSTKQVERRLSREAERRSSFSKYSTHVSGQVSTKNQTIYNMAPAQDQESIPLQIPTENQSLYNDPTNNDRQHFMTQQATICSDMKPIQMQQTDEKGSSRPLSSLYVDDADEDEESSTAHYNDNVRQVQRQIHHQVQPSMPLSQDESDTTFNPDQLINGFNVSHNEPKQDHLDSIEQPYQKISVEEAINSSDCKLRLQQLNRQSDVSHDDTLMKTILQNENNQDEGSGLPRVDIETGEVYQKSTFKKINTDDLKITQETTQDVNEMTMYQHLDMDDQQVQVPIKFENNRESIREEDIDLPLKLSHRYQNLSDQQQKVHKSFKNNKMTEQIDKPIQDINAMSKSPHNLYHNQTQMTSKTNSHQNSKQRNPSSHSIKTPSWNPYIQQCPQLRTCDAPKGVESFNSQKRLQRSKQRLGRNNQAALTVNATGSRNQTSNITRGSVGASSNGANSLKSLHNASPLTYLMKDTKVLDSEKIMEPVLRQKYQKTNSLGRMSGYSKYTTNLPTTNMPTQLASKMQSSLRSLSKSKFTSNNVSTQSLRRDRNQSATNLGTNKTFSSQHSSQINLNSGMARGNFESTKHQSILQRRSTNHGSRNHDQKKHLVSSQTTKSGGQKKYGKMSTGERNKSKDMMSSNQRESNNKFNSSIVCGQQIVINNTTESSQKGMSSQSQYNKSILQMDSRPDGLAPAGTNSDLPQFIEKSKNITNQTDVNNGRRGSLNNRQSQPPKNNGRLNTKKQYQKFQKRHRDEDQAMILLEKEERQHQNMQAQFQSNKNYVNADNNDYNNYNNIFRGEQDEEFQTCKEHHTNYQTASGCNPADYMMQPEPDDHEHFADDVEQFSSSHRNSTYLRQYQTEQLIQQPQLIDNMDLKSDEMDALNSQKYTQQKQQEDLASSQNQQQQFVEMSTRGSHHHQSLISHLEQQYDKSVHTRHIMNENYLAMQHQDLNFYPSNLNTNGHHANGSNLDDSMLITNQEQCCGEFLTGSGGQPITSSFDDQNFNGPVKMDELIDQQYHNHQDGIPDGHGFSHLQQSEIHAFQDNYDGQSNFHPFENTAYPQINPCSKNYQKQHYPTIPSHSPLNHETNQVQPSSNSRSNSANMCLSKPRKSITSRQNKGMSPSSPNLFGCMSRKNTNPSNSNNQLQNQYATGRSSASFDPMKRSIVQNHLSHKGRVTNLQQEFAEQKQMIKKHLSERVSVLRTSVIQTQKKMKVAINEKEIAEDTVIQLKQSFQQKHQKVVEVKKKTNKLRNELQELLKDVQEIEGFKTSLQGELAQEVQFKSEIQRIAIKYKKLIQEQRKDKEKIAQGLVQQRKIIANLKSRRDQLMDDNNKIYDDFNKVVAQDRIRQNEISKICQIKLSRQDQNVLNC